MESSTEAHGGARFPAENCARTELGGSQATPAFLGRRTGERGRLATQCHLSLKGGPVSSKGVGREKFRTSKTAKGGRTTSPQREKSEQKVCVPF